MTMLERLGEVKKIFLPFPSSVKLVSIATVSIDVEYKQSIISQCSDDETMNIKHNSSNLPKHHQLMD